MPRVVAGRFRGIILDAPKGDETRPTSDKVKEALFSIIQTRVPGSCFLDIFAGTGGIGIEALSRGADSAVLIEKSGKAASVIRNNLNKLRLTDEDDIRLMKSGYAEALKTLAGEGKSFDIIFMDPPYRMAQKSAEEISRIVTETNMLKDDGIFIVEHSSELPFVTDVINMKPNRSCRYGLAVLTFFSKNG